MFRDEVYAAIDVAFEIIDCFAIILRPVCVGKGVEIRLEESTSLLRPSGELSTTEALSSVGLPPHRLRMPSRHVLAMFRYS